MRRLTIRHFDHQDVDARVQLMTDRDFQRNLVDFAAVTSPEALREAQRRTIDEEYETKIVFVLETPAGSTVGYTWITSIDWVSHTCELSIALLPRYRRAYGLVALIRMYDYLYGEMNFDTVVNQVLADNEMLLSAQAADRRAQVRARQDSFTVGRFCDSLYWTQTRAEHYAFAQQAVERNARVRELAAAARAA
jgi:RimJ/RimL family protein N-acetyltransferase